jgi:hypothetical protein
MSVRFHRSRVAAKICFSGCLDTGRNRTIRNLHFRFSPGYVFVQTAPAQPVEVLRSPGVIRIVSSQQGKLIPNESRVNADQT